LEQFILKFSALRVKSSGNLIEKSTVKMLKLEGSRLEKIIEHNAFSEHIQVVEGLTFEKLLKNWFNCIRNEEVTDIGPIE